MEQTSTYTKELVLSDSSLSLIPSTWDAEVRRLRMSDRREAGLALAQSFATDPLSLYLMGVDDASCWSSEQLWKLHVRLMVCSYASFKFRGIATSVGPDFDAVALWYETFDLFLPFPSSDVKIPNSHVPCVWRSADEIPLPPFPCPQTQDAPGNHK